MCGGGGLGSVFNAILTVAEVAVAIVAPEIIPAIGAEIVGADAGTVAVWAAGAAAIGAGEGAVNAIAAGDDPSKVLTFAALGGFAGGVSGGVSQALSTSSTLVDSVGQDAASAIAKASAAAASSAIQGGNVLASALGAGVGSGLGNILPNDAASIAAAIGGATKAELSGGNVGLSAAISALGTAGSQLYNQIGTVNQDQANVNYTAQVENQTAQQAQAQIDTYNQAYSDYQNQLAIYNQAKADYNNFGSGNTSYANNPNYAAVSDPDSGQITSYVPVKTYTVPILDGDGNVTNEMHEVRSEYVLNQYGQTVTDSDGNPIPATNLPIITQQYLADIANAAAQQATNDANITNQAGAAANDLLSQTQTLDSQLKAEQQQLTQDANQLSTDAKSLGADTTQLDNAIASQSNTSTDTSGGGTAGGGDGSGGGGTVVVSQGQTASITDLQNALASGQITQDQYNQMLPQSLAQESSVRSLLALGNPDPLAKYTALFGSGASNLQNVDWYNLVTWDGDAKQYVINQINLSNAIADNPTVKDQLTSVANQMAQDANTELQKVDPTISTNQAGGGGGGGGGGDTNVIISSNGGASNNATTITGGGGSSGGGGTTISGGGTNAGNTTTYGGGGGNVTIGSDGSGSGGTGGGNVTISGGGGSSGGGGAGGSGGGGSGGGGGGGSGGGDGGGQGDGSGGGQGGGSGGGDGTGTGTGSGSGTGGNVTTQNTSPFIITLPKVKYNAGAGGYTPSTQALMQGLSVNPAISLTGEQTQRGTERELVWNEESLRNILGIQ